MIEAPLSVGFQEYPSVQVTLNRLLFGPYFPGVSIVHSAVYNLTRSGQPLQREAHFSVSPTEYHLWIRRGH